MLQKEKTKTKLFSCWFSEGRRPTQTIISLALCLTFLTFDCEIPAEFNVERNVGWRGPCHTPYLVIVMNVGIPPCSESPWESDGFGKGDCVEFPPHSCQNQTLQRGNGVTHENLHSAIAPLSPSSNELQWGWEEAGLECLNHVVWALGGYEGRCLTWWMMQNACQDEFKSLSHLLWKLTLVVADLVLHTVPSDLCFLFHWVLTTLLEAGFYF